MTSLEPPSATSDSSLESLFQSAFQNAATGMALNLPTGEWLTANRSLCELTGYSEAELRLRSFQDITHPDDLERNLGLQRQMLAGEIPGYEIEKRYIRKDGGIVWAKVRVSLVRENGHPRFLMAEMEDITARKESEREVSEAVSEIQSLRRGLLKICAWTKRIEVDGKWITVDDFLRDRLHLQLTHGISFEGARLLRDQ